MHDTNSNINQFQLNLFFEMNEMYTIYTKLTCVCLRLWKLLNFNTVPTRACSTHFVLCDLLFNLIANYIMQFTKNDVDLKCWTEPTRTRSWPSVRDHDTWPLQFNQLHHAIDHITLLNKRLFFNNQEKTNKTNKKLNNHLNNNYTHQDKQ